MVKIIEVLHYTFDFRKKISANMEHVQNLANKMIAYGIEVGTLAITPMLLANIKTATRHKYGPEFQLAVQIIFQVRIQLQAWQKSLKDIMTEVTKADLVRTLKDAWAPNTATANSVADTIEQLTTLINNKNNTVSDHNTAFGATTDKA